MLESKFLAFSILIQRKNPYLNILKYVYDFTIIFGNICIALLAKLNRLSVDSIIVIGHSSIGTRKYSKGNDSLPGAPIIS